MIADFKKQLEATEVALAQALADKDAATADKTAAVAELQAAIAQLTADVELHKVCKLQCISCFSYCRHTYCCY